MEVLKAAVLAVQPQINEDKQKKDSIQLEWLSFYMCDRLICYEGFYNRSFQRLNCSVIHFCLLKFLEF